MCAFRNDASPAQSFLSRPSYNSTPSPTTASWLSIAIHNFSLSPSYNTTSFTAQIQDSRVRHFEMAQLSTPRLDELVARLLERLQRRTELAASQIEHGPLVLQCFRCRSLSCRYACALGFGMRLMGEPCSLCTGGVQPRGARPKTTD